MDVTYRNSTILDARNQGGAQNENHGKPHGDVEIEIANGFMQNGQTGNFTQKTHDD